MPVCVQISTLYIRLAVWLDRCLHMQTCYMVLHQLEVDSYQFGGIQNPDLLPLSQKAILRAYSFQATHSFCLAKEVNSRLKARNASI
jgi:hypothetical protein